ncbi:MAG: hypothetical protein Q8L29_00745 [archaeon]|nr:hypothetical protein [archaeon]
MDKKSKSFLVLCFIAALLIGIIITEFILITSTTFVKGYYPLYIMIILIFSAISLLTYLSFSSFDIQEKTILFLTLTLSIIISIPAFIGDYFLRMSLNLISTRITNQSGGEVASLSAMFNINGMLNIWLLIALIIITYNIPSIVFMLSKKSQE